MSRVVRGKAFSATRAWDSTCIGELGGFIAKLHWTDDGFPWHRNDGEELLVVIDGTVDMHWRVPGEPERCARLHEGDIWYGQDGSEHRAVPVGEARVLVIERPDADRIGA